MHALRPAITGLRVHHYTPSMHRAAAIYVYFPVYLSEENYRLHRDSDQSSLAFPKVFLPIHL